MHFTWSCSSPDDCGVKVAWTWTFIHIITCAAKGFSSWGIAFSSLLSVLSILIAALFLFCLVVDWRPSGDSTIISHISLWFETFDLLSTFLHSALHSLVFFHGYESNQEASERYCKDGWRQQSNVLCSSAPTWRGQAIPFAWNPKAGSSIGAAQVQVLGMVIWVWWVW